MSCTARASFPRWHLPPQPPRPPPQRWPSLHPLLPRPQHRLPPVPPPRRQRARVAAAGAAALEPALIEQLAPGGTLVAPVNGQLLRLRKSLEGHIEQVNLAPVSFVPLLSGVLD